MDYNTLKDIKYFIEYNRVFSLVSYSAALPLYVFGQRRVKQLSLNAAYQIIENV